MNDYAAAIREALECCAEHLTDDAQTRLGDLLAMFADYQGDRPEDAQARVASTLCCKNCALEWPGFFLPMAMDGRAPMTAIRLAACPRCYSNRAVFLHRATNMAEEAIR